MALSGDGGGFQVVCEVEPATQPDLMRVRHQIGVMSRIASIAVSYHRLPLDPPFKASWDGRPRVQFDATIVRVRDDDPDGPLQLTMEVRIYRERPETARHVKPAVQALWNFLGSQGAA